jgi:iron complex transport system ATP-binding protein
MIDISALSVTLGNTSVLDSVDLSVDDGLVVGLVGPNGAGKTTLLRAVNGAVTPDAGTVRIAGESIHDLSSRAASRRVATVPQETTVEFAFDVETVVGMGRTPHRSRFSRDQERHAAVEDALAATETRSLRNRRIDTLSGGERQRVFIARALAQDAPALVLDEPTASLDVNHATRTLSLVATLADEGRAVLAAIHDLDAAARFCDRLALMHDGEIIDEGPPAAVLSQAAIDEAFDTQSAVTKNPVTGAPTVTPLPTVRQAETTVHVIGGGEPGAQAIATCWAAGYSVTAGPLPAGDTATQVARALDIPVATASPFRPLSETTATDVIGHVRAADSTIIAALYSGDNGRIDRIYQASDRPILLEDAIAPASNQQGHATPHRWDALHDRARMASREDITTIVAEVGRESPMRAAD